MTESREGRYQRVRLDFQPACMQAWSVEAEAVPWKFLVGKPEAWSIHVHDIAVRINLTIWSWGFLGRLCAESRPEPAATELKLEKNVELVFSWDSTSIGKVFIQPVPITMMTSDLAVWPLSVDWFVARAFDRAH